MIKVELGRTGIEYVSSQLAMGRALSRALRELDLTSGTIWTFVDEPTNPGRLTDFLAGGRSGRPGTESAMIEFIHDHLRKGLRSCAVFEDVFAKPGDPVLERSQVPYFACEDDVFNFLVGPEHNLDQVRQLLNTSQAYRLVGVLSEVEGSEPAHDVPFDALRLLVSRAEHVIVGAWDGEGEIVWSRT